MATPRRRAPISGRRWCTRTGVLLAVAVSVAAMAACGAGDDGPRPAVDRFLAAYTRHDVTGAAAATDDPQGARDQLTSAWSGLSATGLTYETGKADVTGDTADIDVTYHWALPHGRTWTYPANIRLIHGGSGWTVRWTATDLHPSLGSDQRLALKIVGAPRATVTEADGSEVMHTGTVIGIDFDAHAAGAASGDAVTALVNALAPIAPGLDAQKIAEESSASGRPYPVTRLSTGDFDRLRDQLALPGVSHTEQAVLTPTDPTFAPRLLTEVGKVVDRDVEGRAGWKVVTLNPNGLDADTLTDHAPDPAPAIPLGLSRQVQSAAQRAVDSTDRFQVATVVLQPSTGHILAVAQNAAADRDGLIATTGLYPPGSTFKMVTAATAISTDLAHPDTPEPCPGEIAIGQRLIPNYDSFSLGTVPMLRAFAQSCNTTFAHLASLMGPADLAHTAAALGLGRDYRIAGLPAVSGSVPIAGDLVDRSVDGFGQGKVLASPFGMAMVAATIAHGSAPPAPQLILGRPSSVTGPSASLPPGVVDQLRPMMREVVTTGTGTAIAGQGEVYGKTGEAEFEGGSHAWFAGYRGDLAFATLVVRGGDSDNAVHITDDMFSFLPPGYGT